MHAAGQVVSVKMLIKTKVGERESENANDKVQRELDMHEALDATTSRLNALLPKDIRVFGIKRTSNSFHAKERCDSRFYEYLLPSYVFAPTSSEPYSNPIPNPFEDRSTSNLRVELNKKKSEGNGNSDDEAEILERQESETPVTGWTCKLTEEEILLTQSYRIDNLRLERLRKFMQNYEGSKIHHNFTIGKDALDPSSRRNIFSVTVSDPFIRNEIEWISIVFHGQSFMLHQIRKMVGLAILSIRLECDDNALLERCFRRDKVNIPKAPALGLLLDKAVFTSYNKRFVEEKETLDFDEFQEVRQRLKDELIYPKILEEEHQYYRFMGWLKCNDEHASEFSFLVPFIKKGS